MLNKSLFKALFVILPILAMLAIAGCSSKSQIDNEEAPTGSSLTVTASPTSLTDGSSTVVEARMQASGSGVQGETVTFTVFPSSAGYFTPADTVTDANGVAPTVFTATGTGSATITASVAGTSLTSNVALAVSAAGGSTSSGNITVASSRSLLLANDADTSQITITVRDSQGQPAPDSTLVKIEAGEKFEDLDGNGYWTPGIDSLVSDANNNGTWDAIGLIPSTAFLTGGQGQATVNFVSGVDAFTVYIKVTVDDNGITDAAQLSLQLTPDAAINSIFLSSDSMQLSVRQTGGIETGLVHANCFDFNGNPVPQGLEVNFVIVSGPGGGERLGNVGYGPFTTYTNGQGIATATIHSGTVSGTVRIRAYADTVMSNATQILVSAGPPKYVVIGAENCNVPFWDNVAEENGIVAIVSDTFLNPVNDSTVVYFTTDEGTMKSHEERTKDHEGIVTTTWFSGNNVATADGIVWIYAETAGGTVLDSTFFFNSHIPAVLSLSGWQTTILADGEDNFYTWVSAVDLNSNFVEGGTTFNGEARYLNVGGGAFENGCYSASDRVKVTSRSLTQDFSRNGGVDDGVGAIDQVTFWAPDGGASVSAVCSLLTSNAYSKVSSINGQTNASVGEVVQLTVTILDRYNNPLADHTINISASGGTINGGGPATVETNAFGETGVFTWSSAGLGDFTITATDVDPRGGITLTHRITVE